MNNVTYAAEGVTMANEQEAGQEGPVEQKHFSLMAELLDDELPEDEQIEALLAHASKELGLTTWQAKDCFKRVGENLQRAFLLNDIATAMQSVISRLHTCWLMEDQGQEYDGGCPEYIEFLRKAVVPILPVERSEEAATG